MKFIALEDVVTGIASCIPPLTHANDAINPKFKDDESVMAARRFWERQAPEIDNARRFSGAARVLNEALHNSDGAPRLAQLDDKIFTESAATEGRDLLTHATGWHARLIKRCGDHVQDCFANGWKPDMMPVGGNMNDGKTPAGSFFRLGKIGFDHIELVAFLDANGIAHNLEEQKKAASAPQVTAVVGQRNSTKTPRRDLIAPVVEHAQSLSKNPVDSAEVYGHLLMLAANKYGPLIGATEEGVQYRFSEVDEPKILTRDAVTKRLVRLATTAAKRY